MLSTFDQDLNIAIIGATGGIGNAFIQELSMCDKVSTIYAFSRKQPDNSPQNTQWIELDITKEKSFDNAFVKIKDIKFDIIINATGILSVGDTSPERSLRDIKFENFEKVFAINTFGPALVMKYFLPLLNRERKSVFGNLSARVGSITDNQLGGWYAYRASKSALNMLVKTASIEVARRNKSACIIGLHPGTVDTNLSEPFKLNVPANKLFTPEFSAQSLLKVIDKIKPENTGKCFDWDGQEVLP